MYALAIKNLPDGKDWLYEVKFDGYRCLAGQHNNVRPVLDRNWPTELNGKISVPLLPTV
jgi:ATP-dependent DNA ligase